MAFTSTRFKRARWIGILPESSLKFADADSVFWKRFKCDAIYEQSGPIAGICYSLSSPHHLLVAASLRAIIRDGGNYDNEKNLCVVDEGVSCVSFRSDGHLAAVGTVTGKLLVIEINSRITLRKLDGHNGTVRSAKFLEDKVHLVSVGDDQAVCLWDISSGALLWKAKENQDFVRALAVPGNSSDMFATGSYDHSVLIWSTAAKSPIIRLDHGSPVESVVFLPNQLVASAGDKNIRIWNLNNGALLKEILIHHKAVTSISVSSDGKYMFSASIDRSLKVLRLSDFQLIHRFKLPAAIMCFSVDSECCQVALGTSSGRVFIFRLRDETNKTTEGIVTRRRTSMRSQTSQEIDFSVRKVRPEPLLQFDRLLKSFRYRHALDAVLARTNPHLLVTAIRELMRREGLIVALSGRSETEIVLIINMIRRYLPSSRHSSSMIELAFTVIEIYAPVLSESTSLFEAFCSLRDLLSKQIRISLRLMELEGRLELIRSSNLLHTLSPTNHP